MAINLYSKASVDSLLSGKLSVSSLSNGAATAIDSTVPTAGKVLSFDGTNLKWVTAASGATWGSITGTLSSQTDLNTALNARVSTAGDTMDNNALLEFNDTFNSTHLGIDGNGVTVESPGLGISANLNKDDLIFTDGVDTASIGLAGVTFADGTTQTTAYTGGGPAWLGSRISIYAGYLYDEDSSTYVSGLTLTGASTVNAQNFTLQASGGGVLTFSDATTQATKGLIPANNLSDLASASTARTNLGLGTMAVETASNYALKASPALTGTPTSTTAAADTNTTQIATTAFVVGQASSTTPAATGTAAVGTSLKYARADHVHANPLPTGGTTGQVLAKVDGTNYNVQWTTAGGGSGGCDVQTFGSSTTSGTFSGASGWQKPAGAKFVWVRLWSGGSGGGSGARQATTSIRGGGGGGAPCAYIEAMIDASLLASTETVTVGAGGAGGNSVTSDNSNGNNGTGGLATIFSYITTGSSQAGSQGTNAGGGSAGAGAWMTNGITEKQTGYPGAGTTTNGNNATQVSAYTFIAGTGGGGGAGAAASVTTSTNGGAGANKNSQNTNPGQTTSTAGGTAGNGSTLVQAGNGTSVSNWKGGGTGGGGGYYATGQPGGAGGNGGWPGGGGGGGGASDNGFASGKGGNGANGFALIITYF